MRYDTVVVLSEKINLDGSLTKETMGRFEKGVEMYLDGLAESLTLSGGLANPEASIKHARAMMNYLNERIPKEKIYLEEKSLDTVGQVFFTKTDVVLPNQFKSVCMITHDYHVKRVEKITSFIFNGQCEVEIVGLPSNSLKNPNVEQREKLSFERFRETFHGVASGDDEGILRAMMERHPLYNQSHYKQI